MTETLQITLGILLVAGILYAWFESARRNRVAARRAAVIARAASMKAHPAGKGR